jgi:hypothetical protein
LEEVTPGPTADIGNTTDGLVLNTANSPPKVSIDGGKRTITLPSGTPGSLITVKTGVTLTLRNITLIGHNSDAVPVVKEDGGRVIYETGVSIYNTGFDGPFSGFTTKPDSAINLIQLAKEANDPSVSLTLSPGTEGVNLNGTSDLGTGLVLNSGNSPAEVTIDGQGRTVQMDAGSASGSIITVGSGVTLTLKNITLAGSSGNTSPLITVETGGTLVLKDGAVITGNKGTTGNSSAVYVTGGTFEMYDGAEISKNGISTYNGYIVKVDGGAFTMHGGTITGNVTRSTYYTGGVSVSNAGTFTMSGGTISNNIAHFSVYINGGAFTMEGSAAIGNPDPLKVTASVGVVMQSGTFTMTGGTISNHSDEYGGGVVMYSGTFTMSGGTISGNTSRNTALGGGGVGVSAGTFIMSGGIISGNTSTEETYGGGGVAVSYSGTFTMSGGTISGNTAGNGGGVFVYNFGGYSGTFTKTAGTIYGNGGAPNGNTAAGGNGHAVYVGDGKKRNSMAGEGVSMDTTKTGAEGGWE